MEAKSLAAQYNEAAEIIKTAILQKELPGLRGFSATSLWTMRKFYENWRMLDSGNKIIKSKNNDNLSPEGNSTIAIVELQKHDNEENIIRSLSVEDVHGFPVEDFFRVPFTHHLRIIEGTDNLDARYYYIHKTAEENLSVDRLTKLIKAGDFDSSAKIPNNFSTAMSNPVNARKAVMMFKDEYLLDFINVEEIGERDSEDVDERVVEKQIVQNVKNFIMTFGHDFTFVGIVLCKNADRSYVEFLIQGYDNPMGVATYKTKEEIMKMLPPEEDLIRLLDEQ